MGVDLVCLIRDVSVSTGNGDRFVLDLVKRSEKPALLLLNKIDKIEEKSALLPLIDWYSKEHDWSEIVPISALKKDQIDVLIESCLRHLPEGDPIFAEDELTDQSLRVLVAEIVRETGISDVQAAGNRPQAGPDEFGIHLMRVGRIN